MSERKELGKIDRIKVGFGGYQDVCFGISFGLSTGNSSYVNDFWGAWSPSLMKHDSHCKWNEATRSQNIDEAFRRLDQLLTDAKRTDASQLVGTPIEVTFDNMMLVSWRVLTEVL